MGSDATQLDEEEAALQAQQELLESCLDLVFVAYDEARSQKVKSPVVYLLDCEDEIGQQIASAWLGEDVVRDAVTEQRLDDPEGETTTVFAHAFPLDKSREEVSAVFPYLAPVFEASEFKTGAPSDGFLTIAVTAGGASAFTVPLSAREESQ